VGGLRRSVSFLLNKELDGDTQITKQQQNFIERKKVKAGKSECKEVYHKRWVGSGEMA
jgi:hypothetical protein